MYARNIIVTQWCSLYFLLPLKLFLKKETSFFQCFCKITEAFLSHILESWTCSCVFQSGPIHSWDTVSSLGDTSLLFQKRITLSNISLSSKPLYYGWFLKNWSLKQITMKLFLSRKGSFSLYSLLLLHFSLTSSCLCLGVLFQTGFMWLENLGSHSR